MIWNYKITCYTMILYWGSTKNLCAVTIENEITLQVWKTCHVETWHFTWWHVQVEYVDILVAFCSNILLTPNLLAHIFTSNGYALWSAFVTRSHRAQESELAGLTSLHGGTLPCFSRQHIASFLQCRQQWHLYIYHTTQDLPIALHRLPMLRTVSPRIHRAQRWNTVATPNVGLPSFPTLHFARRQWCCQLPNWARFITPQKQI